MSLKDIYAPRIETALEDIKRALAAKDVVCDTLKVSEVPEKIREIELAKYVLTITATEFEGQSLTVSKDNDSKTCMVESGTAEVKIKSPGTWRVSAPTGDYVDVVVGAEEFSKTAELVKKRVTFTEAESSAEKIVIHIESITGNNSNSNQIRVKKNGSVISANVQYSGSDLTITEFEYEDGATYTIEYVLGDEVRGSIEVKIKAGTYAIKNNGLIVDKNLLDGQRVKHVVFTDEKAPEGQTTGDLAGDGSVVAWFIKDTQTYYVSTQKPGKKVKCAYSNKPDDFGNGDVSWFVEASIAFGHPMTSESKNEIETIDLKNFAITGNSASHLFTCLVNLKEIKNLDKVDFNEVANFDKMFLSCESLQSIDLTCINAEKIHNADYMFMYDSQLETIYSNEWNILGSNIFKDCTSLPNYDSAKVDGTMAKWKENGGYFTNPAEKPS